MPGDTRARLRRLYRVATRMTPSEAMLELIGEYYAGQLADFTADAPSAQALIEVGVTEPDSNVDAVTLAAMTNTAALIMNSPEAWTVR
jgi:hypothetical protein